MGYLSTERFKGYVQGYLYTPHRRTPRNQAERTDPICRMERYLLSLRRYFLALTASEQTIYGENSDLAEGSAFQGGLLGKCGPPE